MEKKDKTKTILLIIIVILLMALTLFVGYYFGQKSNKQTDKDNTKVEEKTKETEEEEEKTEEKQEEKVETKDYSKYSIVKEYSNTIENTQIKLVFYGEKESHEDIFEFAFDVDIYFNDKYVTTDKFNHALEMDDDYNDTIRFMCEQMLLKKYGSFYLIGLYESNGALGQPGSDNYYLINKELKVVEDFSSFFGNVVIDSFSDGWIDIKDKSIRYIENEDYSSKTKEYTITFDGDNYKKTETGTYDLSDCGDNDNRVTIAGQC